MNWVQKVLFMGAAVAALVAGVYMSQQKEKKAYHDSTFVYQPARTLQPFSLIDHKNQPFGLQQLSGKWSFVFLGYLSCPDICPMTMAKFSRMLPDLKTIDDDTQVIFVSADPKRDTTDSIAQYVDYFHPDIIGVRAEHTNLFPFVRNLGLMYSVPSQDEEENYAVDHSASVILINPDGQIAAIFKPEIKLNQVPTINTEILLSDFKLLLD